MNFHSDDELGVKNTIAAISLGAPAKMSFRPRKQGTENPKVCLELILKHVRTFIAAL
jgi:alkylated DNA repair dioxygenase AlkB